MDLIILAVLLPLIIVPIVLLSGFAGCASFSTSPDAPVPPPPFNLQATAVSTDQIDLTWQHNSAGGVEFRVGRQRADGSWDDVHATPTPTTAMAFSDKFLDEGKTYNYRVRAITPSISSTPSDPSNEKAATTWKWETAYNEPLTKPPALDGLTYSGDCVVQRIDKTLLKFSGKRTRLTLRGSTTLTIPNVYISRAIPGTGSNRWQPGTDLTQVSGGIIVAADTPQTLPDVGYALTNSEDLLIAFDIASGDGRRLTAGVGASVGFLKSGTLAVPVQEASRPTRTTTGWTTHANTVFLVERIDVLIT